MKGKDLLKKYDRDESRMANYLAGLKTKAKLYADNVDKYKKMLKIIEPEIIKFENMTLEDFVKAHPDVNYTGVMQGKVGGKEYKT